VSVLSVVTYQPYPPRPTHGDRKAILLHTRSMSCHAAAGTVRDARDVFREVLGLYERRARTRTGQRPETVLDHGRIAEMFDVVYRNARRRLTELVSALSAEQLRTPVAATPTWTVHELFAHLVGGAADMASGRLDGLPGDEWTARHVGERRHRPISELLAEWDLVGPRAESSCAGEVRGPNLGLDIICHEGDLHETLGLGRAERDHWQPALDAMVSFLGRRLKQPGTLVIRDGHGQEWSFGDGEPWTMLTVDGYELLRGMFSRRSQRQIAGWDWAPAPAERMQRLGVFGPREDDQPIPAT
jgi:uncharacterized protein (TIGR03083 family)